MSEEKQGTGMSFIPSIKKAILDNTTFSLKTNNSDFSNRILLCYFNKNKLPRKIKKKVKNYFLSKGKYKNNDVVFFDEAWKLWEEKDKYLTKTKIQ